jgi:hypothetical protein
VLSPGASTKADEAGEGSAVTPAVESEEDEAEWAGSSWNLTNSVMPGVVEVAGGRDEAEGDMREQGKEERERGEMWSISTSVAPGLVAAQEEPLVGEDDAPAAAWNLSESMAFGPGGAKGPPEEEDDPQPLIPSRGWERSLYAPP